MNPVPRICGPCRLNVRPRPVCLSPFLRPTCKQRHSRRSSRRLPGPRVEATAAVTSVRSSNESKSITKNRTSWDRKACFWYAHRWGKRKNGGFWRAQFCTELARPKRFELLTSKFVESGVGCVMAGRADVRSWHLASGHRQVVRPCPLSGVQQTSRRLSQHVRQPHLGHSASYRADQSVR
jgi:hypothetical protein